MVNNFGGNSSSTGQASPLSRAAALDSRSLELYQSFMTGYVRRINDATFRVTIGGIRIGSAKYSRLAQINLKTRIITFSRFAIENVPERGRRYLVIHELAHVLEPSHNRTFWDLVGRHEPNHKAVSNELDRAFKHNVKDDQRQKKGLLLSGTGSERLFNRLLSDQAASEISASQANMYEPASSEQEDELYECMDMDDEYDWQAGTVCGGLALDY